MTKESWVVYVAGNRWDGTRGTDQRLVEAMGRRVKVLWAEPPASVLSRDGRRRRRPGREALSTVATNVVRLDTAAPPGFTRYGIRSVATVLQHKRIREALHYLGAQPLGVVLAGPLTRFPDRLRGRRIVYLTDDWLAGAPMMGLSPAAVRHRLRRNLAEADEIVAVSPGVAGSTHGLCQRKIDILPNGCTVSPIESSLGSPRRKVACLVGQLNERIDLDVLEAVLMAGVTMQVIGPRREREGASSRRWDAFLSRPGVTWLGAVPERDVPGHLASAAVGMTPYRDTVFNRASFPLKTLEYLAAGLPVVSTDLPAVHWLDTPHIEVGRTPDDFADRVARIVAMAPDRSAEQARRRFASQHSWDARAERLLSIMDGASA